MDADRPHQGVEHVALRTALWQSRVLDWLLPAALLLEPQMHFVGGYQACTAALARIPTLFS